MRPIKGDGGEGARIDVTLTSGTVHRQNQRPKGKALGDEPIAREYHGLGLGKGPPLNSNSPCKNQIEHSSRKVFIEFFLLNHVALFCHRKVHASQIPHLENSDPNLQTPAARSVFGESMVRSNIGGFPFTSSSFSSDYHTLSEPRRTRFRNVDFCRFCDVIYVFTALHDH